MEQHYCAFISYRHVSPDADAAKRLHTAIETYGIPGSVKKQTGRRSMGKVFRDQEELPLSANLGAGIETALDNSDWLICVCSPRYPQSLWCLRELEYFIQRKGRDRVLAVLVEGEPGESFPELLQWETGENGERTPVEPLAADLRGADRAKFRTESLRLLAPMLGVSFDDLKRRGRQRRIRRACAAGAAALVLAGGVSAYAIANRAKNESLRLAAEEQQRIAQAQQALAEEEAKRAEAEKARAAEESQRAEEEKARASEEKAKAEEEARRAEEERLRAVSNSIGELLERASAHLSEGERRAAAAELLEALELGSGEGGLRREETVALLRRTLYITPFTPISSFSDRNVRLLDIVPSPDGKLAAGIENGNSAALLDLEANELRYRVRVGNEQIGRLCFSPDGGRFLAVCEKARMVVVWNTEDGSEAFRYVSRADREYQIANACFWRDGDTLLVQDMDRFYLVFADGSEKLLYTMGQQQDWYDPEVNIHTLLFSSPLEDLITLYNDDYIGASMSVSADGSRILVSGRDGSTGTLILDEKGNCVTPLYGMPGTLAEKYALSADGRIAACVSEFGFLAWWNGETGELMGIYGYDNSTGRSASSVVFSPKGDRLALVVNDTLQVYDTATGDQLISGTMDSTGYTPSLSFSDDGDWLFLMNQSLYIVSARSGALYVMERAEADAPFNNAVQVGDLLFLTRGDGSASLRCMPALSCVRRLGTYAGELSPAYDPARAPTGTRVPALKGEHRLTDAFKMGTQLTDLSPRQYYDREGKRAALFYPDGVIELFELDGDGSVAGQLGLLTREAAAFGMTRRWLAACDAGGQFLIYDLEEETAVRVLKPDTPYLRFVFDAAGDRLMALGQNGVIDVYDLPAAQLLFSLRSEEAFTDFAFAADGSAALGFTGSYVEAANLWASEEALLTQARRIAG